MIRGRRQPVVLPLAFDPCFQEALASKVQAAYLSKGPVDDPERRSDGSGVMRVEVDETVDENTQGVRRVADGIAEVEIPAGTVWFELTRRWSADDEDDLQLDVGPADPLGGIVAGRLEVSPDLERAARDAIAEELSAWLARHQASLTFGAGDEDESSKRRQAALADLAQAMLGHISAPAIAGRLNGARRAAAALDHPLSRTIEDTIAELDRLRPRAEADLDVDERRAWRSLRKRDRKLRREMARRVLIRFIGAEWDDVPADQHWTVAEDELPAVRLQLVADELVAHANRVSTRLRPKPQRGSSQPSG